MSMTEEDLLKIVKSYIRLKIIRKEEQEILSFLKNHEHQIPYWIARDIYNLYICIDGRDFTIADIKNNISTENPSVLLSDAVKLNLLTRRKDTHDFRKTIYSFNLEES